MTTQAPDVQLLTPDEILSLGALARTDASANELMTQQLLRCVQLISVFMHKLEALDSRFRRQEHVMARLMARLYGQKQERLDPAQLLLFLQEEFPGMVSPMDCQAPDAPADAGKRRPKGHGRDSFPPGIPRRRVPLDLSAEDCVCKGCSEPMARFGEDVTERGSFIPGVWEVVQYVRGKFSCKKGCPGVFTAELPPALVEKAKFEPSVAVAAAVAKYADHTPLERQAQAHERLGMPVSPSTLDDSVLALSELHAPTLPVMREETVQESTIHADNTPVKSMLEIPDPDAPHKMKKVLRETQIWVYLAACGKVVYDFTLDKSATEPERMLQGFSGNLVTDGASNFNLAVRSLNLVRCGCWAHVRRKFFEALASHPKGAMRAFRLINRLFWIERAMKVRRSGKNRDFGDGDIATVRRRRSVVVLRKLRKETRRLKGQLPPKDPLGVAVDYTLSQRKNLLGFLRQPEVPIHNNAAERALRAVAVGRKNYLFFGSERGGNAARVFYSLIGSCKALGINPHTYLMETTATLLADPQTPRSTLTPWAWAKARRQKLSLEFAADLNPAKPG
jgi:transposase